MRRLGAILAAAALSDSMPAMASQDPFPTPEQILPPAPKWQGKSERLVAKKTDPWVTPSELTGLTATPSYDDTIAWLRWLDAASPLIRMEAFGRTPQGRDLWLVIASKDAVLNPDKPKLLAQAGIHSGEIDGKDAGLMLLRDIAFRGKEGLLDGADLLFVPVLSADAHERSSVYNRPNQRGPVAQGWRNTAQNLNLNRDYVKLDAPETRGIVSVIRRYDPTLYLDLHVTDGADYQYDITYGYEGWDGRYDRSERIAAWLEQRYRPALDRELKAQGHIPGPLVFAADDRDPLNGVAHFASTPRFSTGYGDLVRTPTVLVENHSLKPYRQRVLGTYVLIEQSLKALAAHGAELRAAMAADRAERPAQIPSGWRPVEQPVAEWDFLPIENETYVSPASGREEVRWLGRRGKARKVKVFGQEPSGFVARPVAYWVPPTKPEVIERLRAHGIAVEELSAPRTVELEMVRARGAKPGPASEGHVVVRADAFEAERRRETFPAGSVRVPTDQPLGDLAMILLDPRSGDSLFAWGFFPEILTRVEYIEGYAIAPLAEKMLADDPALKAEFEAKLAADPDFAKNGDARLQWFYERTPYFDDRWLLYPVGIER
ncbi:MAG TPA: M14 family metallopeptidase [Caulobacteraceae bacterium]|nr:M14 family metallopeptidase [Caulobacteraceae bacterium]